MLIEEFKNIRKLKKISVQDISDLTGIPLRTIQNWEYRKCMPSLELFEKALKAIGKKLIVVDDLLNDK